MRASLTNYKQSPRKVRLVADMIRGKKVSVARDSLVFLAKKSSPEIIKLLNSAIANARMKGMNPDDLVVKTISVDKGMVIKRFMPKARGRAAGIHRTMSHVTLELAMPDTAKPENSKSKKSSKLEAKR